MLVTIFHNTIVAGLDLLQVLSLHGWLDCADSFSHIAPQVVFSLQSYCFGLFVMLTGALLCVFGWYVESVLQIASRGCCVIAFDLPGHGKSSWSSNTYHHLEYVSQVFVVLFLLHPPVQYIHAAHLLCFCILLLTPKK